MKQRKLNNIEIASFCNHTAMLFQAGITPAESMNILLNDTKSSDGKEVLTSILEVCTQGEKFSTALKSTNLFPNYVVHMVSLGEESGNTDVVMQSLANYYEKEEAISENIHNAVSYPFIMITMMILVIFVLIGKVLPIFNQVYIQLGSEMSGFSSSLMNIGTSLSKYTIVFITILMIIITIYLLITKTATGKRTARRLFSSFFVTRSFYEKIAAGRFASGMALTISSGLDVFTSLDMVSELVEHKGMQEKIAHCKKAITDGSNFAEALVSSNIFTNLYSRMVSVGFKAGNIDTVMQKISENYDKETDKKIHSIISILEPTLVIILSVIVGFILLSVILPLMGIMSSIG